MARQKPASYVSWYRAWKKNGAKQWPEVATLVVIAWTDATYAEEAEHTGPIKATLLGFLLEATPDHIVLAMETYEDRSTRTHVTVPARMVNTIATLGSLDLVKG